MSAKEPGQAVRAHRRIEGGLRRSLDVSSREGDSRAQRRNEGADFALLGKVASSLSKRHPGESSVGRKRYAAALDASVLEETLTSPSNLGDV